MINKVTFTLKDDFYEISLSRDEGSRFVEMLFHYHSGMRMARFELADLKKAVELLEEQEET